MPLALPALESDVGAESDLLSKPLRGRRDRKRIRGSRRCHYSTSETPHVSCRQRSPSRRRTRSNYFGYEGAPERAARSAAVEEGEAPHQGVLVGTPISDRRNVHTKCDQGMGLTSPPIRSDTRRTRHLLLSPIPGSLAPDRERVRGHEKLSRTRSSYRTRAVVTPPPKARAVGRSDAPYCAFCERYLRGTARQEYAPADEVTGRTPHQSRGPRPVQAASLSREETSGIQRRLRAPSSNSKHESFLSALGWLPKELMLQASIIGPSVLAPRTRDGAACDTHPNIASPAR